MSKSLHTKAHLLVKPFIAQQLKRCGMTLGIFVFTFSKIAANDQDSITVYFFLSETCPICQSVTQEVNTVYELYNEKGIGFEGIFPNVNTSTTESIAQFAEKYGLHFPMTVDENQELKTRLSATITPEVFVVRNSDNTVLYSGRIDNGYVRVGKRRQVITEHSLRLALDSVLEGKTPKPARTDAIGCYIMKIY